MFKSEKLIILGPSGSGKDYLMRKSIEQGLKGCVKMTTRPMRMNESQGVSYNFVEIETFKKNIEADNFVCYQKFDVTPIDRPSQTWYYGITKEEFENSQVAIMTPGEFNQLHPLTRKKCFVVYLDIDRNVRENRLFIRKDNNDSIKRRLDADELDFKNFLDYDLKIHDPEFDVDSIISLMN